MSRLDEIRARRALPHVYHGLELACPRCVAEQADGDWLLARGEALAAALEQLVDIQGYLDGIQYRGPVTEQPLEQARAVLAAWRAGGPG